MVNTALKAFLVVTSVGLAFLVGWLLNDAKHLEHEEGLRQQAQVSLQLARSSSEMADKSLQHALLYQETLNTCLDRMSLHGVKDDTK